MVESFCECKTVTLQWRTMSEPLYPTHPYPPETLHSYYAGRSCPDSSQYLSDTLHWLQQTVSVGEADELQMGLKPE